MIVGKHGVVRTADIDDAAGLKRLYDPAQPRAALLDRRREILRPSLDDFREMLDNPKTKDADLFYAVEDAAGDVRGFCALRTAREERSFAQFVLLLFDDADYAAPVADHAFAFLSKRAFEDMKLSKVSTHCLDTEQALRAMLVRQGFQSDGVQREVLFTHGAWHDLESMTLFADAILDKGDL